MEFRTDFTVPVIDPKFLVASFYDAINAADIDLLHTLVSNRISVHHPLLPDDLGQAGFWHMVEEYFRAFASQRITVHELQVEDDTVTASHTHQGIYVAEFFGFAATGEQVTFSGTDRFVVRNRRIVELWLDDDLCHLIPALSLQPADAVPTRPANPSLG